MVVGVDCFYLFVLVYGLIEGYCWEIGSIVCVLCDNGYKVYLDSLLFRSC